ncbi:MAG TPA: DegT/DnrJ/EryC1/StrS family aminotransferase [bacterium]|nr:DegT/DnrJ/EryC1/StrS family aminotransferase [bacterium]HQI48652.1 DegT/DnrJ/EryC1/StrS family aminotransferase [bacterium]HQJ66100.1 DegT/DnrJ/EryC1/StrS family aminotransferase [bacterium]
MALAINGGTPVRTKPFPVWPVWGDEEIEGLTRVIKSGKWGRLAGKESETFEKLFAEAHAAKHGIALNSGTTALRVAMMAADVDAGDEIIVPAYTFIATASAAVEAGAIPIFVDIDRDTYNIDPALVEAAITPRTKAIMPVHFAGRPADMDAIMQIAAKHNLVVIEDAAQAWGSAWNGRPVGAIGAAGCFSFQSSKNINCGEGGIILTNDDVVAKFARSHHNCGRSDDGLWYEHFYFGGNYRITEFQSAVLLAQMGRYEELKAIRRANLDLLNELLGGIAGISPLPMQKEVTSHSCHLYIFRYDKTAFAGKSKSAFINAMRKEGIPTSPGYSLPLYKQPVFMNKSFGPRGKKVDLPVDYTGNYCPESEKACYEEGIWFTQSILLGTEEDMDDIATAIGKVQQHATEMPD